MSTTIRERLMLVAVYGRKHNGPSLKILDLSYLPPRSALFCRLHPVHSARSSSVKAMSHTPFKIDLRSFPEEGRVISGSLPPQFFDLSATDDVRAVSPLKFDLTVARDGKDLTVNGCVEADFDLMCGRCLQRFGMKVAIDDYETEASIEDASETIDLTDAIREDILLALPSYPRCENGNIDPRECPAQGKFEPATDESAPDDLAGPQAPGVWNVLDQLKKS